MSVDRICNRAGGDLNQLAINKIELINFVLVLQMNLVNILQKGIRVKPEIIERKEIETRKKSMEEQQIQTERTGENAEIIETKRQLC